MVYIKLFVILCVWLGLAECIPSFARPDYPPSTIENDGTETGRYDVRKTMAILNSETNHVNSYYFLLWVTTTDGKKYHYCIDPILFGNSTTGGVFSLNDLNDPSEFKAVGGSNRLPGYGSTEFLNVRSATHNVTSPRNSDNFSTIALDADFAGVSVNTVLSPTGKNMYYGGVGGIVTPGFGNDFSIVPPGWSWYWANPHLKVSGTVTIGGKQVEIDSEQSFGMLERQYGRFDVSTYGFYLLWAYLPNGIVFQVWVISPQDDGTGLSSLATVWHPNGHHEVLAVNMSSTQAWDESISNTTGRKYFNKFKLVLENNFATFEFDKPIRDAEVAPSSGQQGLVISESYCEGNVTLAGETLPWFGHCEELSVRHS